MLKADYMASTGGGFLRGLYFTHRDFRSQVNGKRSVMKALLNLSFVLCATLNLRAQSLFSVLHLNEETAVHHGVPKLISETRTFYNTDGVDIKQDITEFDSLGLPVSLKVLDERKQVASVTTFRYDRLNRVILEKHLSQLKVRFPTNKVRTVYAYDALGHLVNISYYNQEGNVVTEVHLTNDATGLPTEFRLYEPPGNMIGVELGTYRPSENQAILQVVNNKGEVLSSDTLKISFKNAHQFNFPATTKYNQHGDVIASQSRWHDGSIHYKEFDYEYDGTGNWIEQRAYEVTFKKNGKKNRKLKSLFSREINYWNS